MKRLISLFLVSSLVVGLLVVGMAAQGRNPHRPIPPIPGNGGRTATAKVGFGLNKWLELSIVKGDFVDFGSDLDPTKTYKKPNATILQVKSNLSWKIEVEENVKQAPNGADEEAVKKALFEKLSSDSGTGIQKVKVSYTLDNLETLPHGEYGLEVVFTATAK